MAIYFGDKNTYILKNIVYNNRFAYLTSLGENKFINYKNISTYDDINNNIVLFDGEIEKKTIQYNNNELFVKTKTSSKFSKSLIKSANSVIGFKISWYPSTMNYNIYNIKLKESYNNKTIMTIQIISKGYSGGTINVYNNDSELLTSNKYSYNSNLPISYIEVYNVPSGKSYGFQGYFIRKTQDGQQQSSLLFGQTTQMFDIVSPPYLEIEQTRSENLNQNANYEWGYGINYITYTEDVPQIYF